LLACNVEELHFNDSDISSPESELLMVTEVLSTLALGSPAWRISAFAVVVSTASVMMTLEWAVGRADEVGVTV
jgi:hypothetical protein